MAGTRTPGRGAERRTFGIAVLVVSTCLVMTADGGMFLRVVSLKHVAEYFGWPRSVHDGPDIGSASPSTWKIGCGNFPTASPTARKRKPGMSESCA